MTTTRRGMKVAALTAAAVMVLVCLATWWYWRELKAWVLIWRHFERLPVNAQGYPEYRHRPTGIVFVHLQGGTFLMGSPEEERQSFIEAAVMEGQLREMVDWSTKSQQPPHEVKLSPFLIAKYEVSQAEWKSVMNLNPSYFKGDDLPVEKVSWNDCQEFCRKTGLKLPTEAQWEYACRAATSGPYAGTGRLEDMGWHRGNSGIKTHPVGLKQPNGFGLHDMHGNVHEWCEDVYNHDFYSQPEAIGPDPLCTSGPEFRVVRGGSSGSVARCCSSTYRFGAGPSGHVISGAGFRPAVPIPQ